MQQRKDNINRKLKDTKERVSINNTHLNEVPKRQRQTMAENLQNEIKKLEKY